MFKKSFSILILLIAAWVPTSGGPAPRRLEVAITFDDLPVISTLHDDKSLAEITNKLLTTFKQSKAPIIGFVNETKLYSNNELDPARVALLKAWLDAGPPLVVGTQAATSRMNMEKLFFSIKTGLRMHFAALELPTSENHLDLDDRLIRMVRISSNALIHAINVEVQAFKHSLSNKNIGTQH